jgi:uncharacterized membrane protein
MDVSPLRTASLLGAASGLRTFSGPAALALHGRLGRGRVRAAIVAAGAGELAFDKLPGVPARTHVSGLGARLTTGTLSGHRVAGAPGAAIGGAAAMGTAFAGLHARTLLVERLPVPDPVVGAAEDAIVLCLVALATRERPPEAAADAAERAAARGGRVAAGVAATAVGTAAMTAAQSATYALTDAQPSDAPGEVGRRLLEGVFGRRVRRRERGALNHAMHWLYGTSWGVALGALTAGDEEPPPVAPTGLALGLGVWAASLVELPALDVAPPVWRQSPRQIAADAGFHLVYGFAAAATLAWLRRRPD